MLFFSSFVCSKNEDVISVYIKEKIGNFSANVKFGPQKCPVYLKLPWIGDSSLRFESQIKQAITNCFFAVNMYTREICEKAKMDEFQLEVETFILPAHNNMVWDEMRYK